MKLFICVWVPTMFPDEVLTYMIAKKHIERYHEDYSAANYKQVESSFNCEYNENGE